MPYQPKYSQFIKDEIKRLAAGNADERKRARTVKEKISAILLDPLNNIYKKTLPDDYCAVDIGERFRLFFKPLPLLRTAYFAWINDESFPHSVGSKHTVRSQKHFCFRRR